MGLNVQCTSSSGGGGEVRADLSTEGVHISTGIKDVGVKPVGRQKFVKSSLFTTCTIP